MSIPEIPTGNLGSPASDSAFASPRTPLPAGSMPPAVAPQGHFAPPAQYSPPGQHSQSVAGGMAALYRPANLASPGVRLGASLINGVLLVVTLGIGYLIWTLSLWSKGQNPGKKMLGLKVIHADTGADVNWNHMAIRSVALPVAISLIPLGQLVDIFMIFGDRHQRLTDKWAHTLVVKL